MSTKSKIVTIAGIAMAAGAASAQITITQQNAAAPTYSTTLNFDEVGTATGANSTDAWAGLGLAIADSGAGNGFNVGDWDGALGGWGLGSGNSALVEFGMFSTWDSDLSEFSVQVWDPSGAPSPFGGGLGVFVFNDGVEVAGGTYSPAFGGLGDSWFNITSAGGAAFDEVRILGFGFDPSTFVDNLSWNAVPSPASAALLGMGGLVATRRRRA